GAALRARAGAAALQACDVALNDNGARPGGGALTHRQDARRDRPAVRAGERDLLAHDRRQVAVEGEHELLDVLAARIRRARPAGRDVPARYRAGAEAAVEDRRVVEAKERVDAAVVEEAE